MLRDVPLVVGIRAHGRYVTQRRGVVGEDPDHVGALLVLGVELDRRRQLSTDRSSSRHFNQREQMIDQFPILITDRRPT